MRERAGGRWRCSIALCSVAIKLCWRRRSSGASSKLRVSRVMRKHESALKTASTVKESYVRLRGRGCSRELVMLGNLERQDSGRESIPVARSRGGVVHPMVFYSLRHIRFSSGTLTFPILCIVHAIVKYVSILRSFFTPSVIRAVHDLVARRSLCSYHFSNYYYALLARRSLCALTSTVIVGGRQETKKKQNN